MSAITAEDLSVFVEQLKRLLADRSSQAEVRRLSETPEGYDPAVWRALADLGVAGLIIEEAHGGFGGDAVALERVMEEVGAALLCSPLLSSAILAPALLQALDDDAAKARLLPDLASGAKIATVAITGPSAGWIEGHVAVDATAAGTDWSLTGKAAFVTHAHIADVLLVVANAPDGIAVFEVDPKAVGVSLTSRRPSTIRCGCLTSIFPRSQPAVWPAMGPHGRRWRPCSIWRSLHWLESRPVARAASLR